MMFSTLLQNLFLYYVLLLDIGKANGICCLTGIVFSASQQLQGFYNHFEDIYALLKWVSEEEAIDIVKQFDLVVNTEEAFGFIMNYVEENKHIINCAYDSMGHEELKRFFYSDIIGIICESIQNGEDRLGVSVDEAFKEFLARFYTEAASGIMIDWVKNRVSQDRETVLQDMLLICRVSIPAILKAKAEC